MSEGAEFARMFPEGTIVRLNIQLPSQVYSEEDATVLKAEEGIVHLELLNGPLPYNAVPDVKAKVYLTDKRPASLVRCYGTLEKPVAGARVVVRVVRIDTQQRREFFRLDVNLPVFYTLPAAQNIDVAKKEWLEKTGGRSAWRSVETNDGRLQVVNLSGSGMRLKTRERFAPQTLVHLELHVPRPVARVIHAIGSAVRSTELQLSQRAGFNYSTAFKFEHIEPNDQETLISYLFGEQREALRKRTS